MSATIVDLIKGTQAVVPVSVKRGMDDSTNVSVLQITNFEGVQSKVFSSTMRGSTGNLYNTNITFYDVPRPVKDNPPSMVTSRVSVRCRCKAYKFYFEVANIKHGCSTGTNFTPYIRKTPISDPRYPPKNPSLIPGACKHIISLLRTLQQASLVK